MYFQDIYIKRATKIPSHLRKNRFSIYLPHMNMQKYLWVVPTLYVSYHFGGKIFEVLADKQEFVDIISVIQPLAPVADQLAYFIGFFDLFVAIAILTFSLLTITKKYHQYIFLWAVVWPFVPASLRYFGGIANFEIVQVLTMSLSALVAYILYKKYN